MVKKEEVATKSSRGIKICVEGIKYIARIMPGNQKLAWQIQAILENYPLWLQKSVILFLKIKLSITSIMSTSVCRDIIKQVPVNNDDCRIEQISMIDCNWHLSPVEKFFELLDRGLLTLEDDYFPEIEYGPDDFEALEFIDDFEDLEPELRDKLDRDFLL